MLNGNGKTADADSGSRAGAAAADHQHVEPGVCQRAGRPVHPLENWDLPVCFGILRRRLEAELNGMGTRECEKVASRCASDNVDHLGFLLQLCELELIDRERRAAERHLKAAKFSTHKTLCRAPAALGHEPHFNTAFRFSPAGRYVF